LDAEAINSVAGEIPTPFYLYSGDRLAQRIEEVRQALGGDTDIYYSIKANPSLGLCEIIAQQRLGAEVASIGELILAERAGFTPRKVLFAGPGKTNQEMEMAVSMGIGAINVESLGEMERLAGIAKANGKITRIGLRINPVSQVKGAQMRMGGGAQQFGIDEEMLDQALDAAKQYASLQAVGLHVYAGTQMFDVDALLAQCRHVLGLARRIAGSLGRPLEMIDFGGGFGVSYFDPNREFDLDAFGQGYIEVVREYKADPRLAGAQLIFELGRYLVAEAGIYVTRVIDVKVSRGKTFAVTDGGMNHHSAATGNFGQVFRKPYPITVVSKQSGQIMNPVSVVGPCCTPLDIFGHDIHLPEVRPGDLVVVGLSGAYGYSASSLAFLSHPTAAEVLQWQGQNYVLREPGRPGQVLQGQSSLKSSRRAVRQQSITSSKVQSYVLAQKTK
jgi:diaminopimelate decarboxylase